MTKTTWTAQKTYAEVWEELPSGARRLVCECGSNGSPRNMVSAQQISALPKLLAFAEACKKTNPPRDEKVGQASTVTIRIHKNEWIEALKAIEQAHARDPKLEEATA